MIEQLIEKVIIDKLAAALATASLSGVQILGAWQDTAATEDPKGIEYDTSRGFLTVKVQPRQHETFTIAEASLSVEIALNVRAEMDSHGTDYLAITDAVSAVLYSWQKSFSTYYSDFAIAEQFSPSGFRLDGGDCGLDQPNAVWTWQQNLTIQGVILT